MGVLVINMATPAMKNSAGVVIRAFTMSILTMLMTMTQTDAYRILKAEGKI